MPPSQPSTDPTPTDSAAGRTVKPSASVYRTLCDYFGDDAKALAFMRAFASAVIRVPSMDAIERLTRERRTACKASAGVDHAESRRSYRVGIWPHMAQPLR
jgi:hypothetical protein